MKAAEITNVNLVKKPDTLKRRIQTIHEGHKQHKCESNGKSFSQAGTLKKHIHTVHDAHKDH